MRRRRSSCQASAARARPAQQIAARATGQVRPRCSTLRARRGRSSAGSATPPPCSMPPPSSATAAISWLSCAPWSPTTGSRRCAVDLLSADERTLLLETWNATAAPYPGPDVRAPALRGPGRARSARHRAGLRGRGAHLWRAQRARPTGWPITCIGLGVGPDERVAICVERSIEHGGRRFSPSSRPAAPMCRSTRPTRPSGSRMLADSAPDRADPCRGAPGPRGRHRRAADPPPSSTSRPTPEAGPGAPRPTQTARPLGLASATSPTSSTPQAPPAQPKGVMVEHRAGQPARRGDAALRRLRRRRRVVPRSTPSPSTSRSGSCWAPLAHGGRLVIVPTGAARPAGLPRADLQAHGVTRPER